MFINFEMVVKYNLTPNEYFLLAAIKQREHWLVDSFKKEDFGRLAEMGIISKQPTGKWKIEHKGQNFIDRLESPKINEKTLQLCNALIGLYERNEKPLGETRKEIEGRLAWFMSETGFKAELIYNTASEYLNESGEYTMSLANLIWRPQSKAFSVHMQLKDSKLFDLISARYNLNPLPFLEPSKKKETEWLMAVAKLPSPPKRGNPDIMFTGSGEKDAERIKNIKQYLFNSLQKI